MKLAKQGLIIPPCGVPLSVENLNPLCINPALRKLRKMDLSIGTLSINQS